MSETKCYLYISNKCHMIYEISKRSMNIMSGRVGPVVARSSADRLLRGPWFESYTGLT